MELCVRHHRNRTRRTPANHEIVGERHKRPVSSEEVHDEHTTTGSLFHRQEAYRGAGTVELGSGDDLADYDRDFLVVGVTSCLPLRIREAIVDHDLENAPLARDERQLLHIMLEFLEQLIGHAHGTVSIASNGAILDADLHDEDRSPLPGRTATILEVAWCCGQPQTAPDSAEPTSAAYFASAPVR